MRLSGTGSTIRQRILHLKEKLDSGETSFLASILDLEDAQITSNRVSLPRQTATIEEFANDAGYLNDQDIPEAAWLESISRETKLDCRMIVNFTPFKEIGLFTLKVIVANNGIDAECEIKLWIVPAPTH